MKVNFILPDLSLAGGIRVAADYAKRLSAWGHEVTVAWPTPSGPSVVERVRGLMRRDFATATWSLKKNGSNHTYFDQGADKIRLVECSNRIVSPEDLPNASVTVCTWWLTLEWMANLPERLGVKVHFIQGDDSQTPGQPMERLLASWRQSMHRIAVSPWLREPIQRIAGDVPVTTVLNGVDPGQFFASVRSKSVRPTIGYTYSPLAIKGCDVIGNAVSEAKRRLHELRVLAFGVTPPATGDPPIPDFVEFVKSPPQNTIREIYSACDWWIWASRVEGFGLPMLEAMACGTPVIATPAGAARELLSTGAGRLIERCDAAKLAESIVQLCAVSNEQWHDYSGAALQYAAGRTNEIAAREFEAALVSFCDQRH